MVQVYFPLFDDESRRYVSYPPRPILGWTERDVRNAFLKYRHTGGVFPPPGIEPHLERAICAETGISVETLRATSTAPKRGELLDVQLPAMEGDKGHTSNGHFPCKVPPLP